MTNSELQNMILVEITDLDNCESLGIKKNEARSIMSDYKLYYTIKDWDGLFKPISDDTTRSKMIEMFKRLDE